MARKIAANMLEMPSTVSKGREGPSAGTVDGNHQQSTKYGMDFLKVQTAERWLSFERIYRKFASQQLAIHYHYQH
jgi:hypothetical protein